MRGLTPSDYADVSTRLTVIRNGTNGGSASRVPIAPPKSG